MSHADDTDSPTRLPWPDELLDSPELATIVVLQRALEAANVALIAAHPVLMSGEPLDYGVQTDEGRCPPTPLAVAALALVRRCFALQMQLAKYRRRVQAEIDRPPRNSGSESPL